jgi:hypothetical protein
MINIFQYFVFISSEPSLIDTLEQAQTMYAQGQYISVEDIYNSASRFFKNNEMFQQEYLNFLVSRGDFKKILSLDNLNSKSLKTRKEAQDLLDVLNSNNVEKIAQLISKSPNCFQVAMAAAKVALKNNNLGDFNKYIEKAQILDKDSLEVLEAMAHKYFIIGEDKAALSLLKQITNSGKAYKRADTLRTIALNYETMMKSVQESVQSMKKSEKNFEMYKKTASTLESKMISDSYEPSIYSFMYSSYLKSFLEVAIDNKYRGALTYYAERLLKITPNKESKILMVKSLAIDGKIKEAKDFLTEHKAEFNNEAISKYLESYIMLENRKHQEEQLKREQERKEQQRRREEQERRRREEQERRKPANGPKAGEDFLGYYAVLKATPRLSSEELRKCHKKATREISMRKRKAKTQEEKEAAENDLKKANKAYQILSEQDKKNMYDAGIDPERPHQHRGNFFQDGKFSDEQDLNEILKMFFSGGGRRMQHRQQFFFFE